MRSPRVLVPAVFFVLFAACSGCKEAPPPWSVPAPLEATRRLTTGGEVIGGEGRYNSYAWLGIPFARPPVGELRWRAPEPVTPWEGTREALKFAPFCVQFANPQVTLKELPPRTVVGSEDCLYLNVYTPRLAPERLASARLPVMVWIHGGGNSTGATSFYEGGHLASKGVVVVAPQYRIGPLGWFHHRALRAGETAEDASGNYGTLDLIHALRWVQDNAAAFGGDPDRVTVFGESAGGFNVFSMLVSPRARGLFHRAISQSGSMPFSTTAAAEHYTDDPEPGHRNSSGEALARLQVAMGLAPTRAVAKVQLGQLTDEELGAWLRQRTPEELMSAYEPQGRFGMIEMPMLFQEGTVLPAEPPLEAFARAGGWANVPFITGTNRDEVKLFMLGDETKVKMRFGILPRLVDPPAFDAAAEYPSRMWRANAVDAAAAAVRSAEGAAPVYSYRFDWDEEAKVLGSDLGRIVGAAHSLEIPFVFGHFDFGPVTDQFFPKDNAQSRRQLSDRMMSYWVQFASTGDPGRGVNGELPPWQPWDPTGRHMVFDSEEGGGVRMREGVEKPEAILADIAKDPRLPATIDKCRVYRQMVGAIRGLTLQQFEQRCPGLKYEEWPWAKK